MVALRPENLVETVCPKILKTATAANAISVTSKIYSTKVAPRCFLVCFCCSSVFEQGRGGAEGFTSLFI